MTLAEINLALGAFNIGIAAFGTMRRVSRVIGMTIGAAGLVAWWVGR